MKAHNDIYTWPMSLVAGTIITLALFFTLPTLRFRQINPEPPVIEIDFMQWREPAPAPKVKTPPPKQELKPKPRPKAKLPPIPEIKPKPKIKLQATPPSPQPIIPQKASPVEAPTPTPAVAVKPEPQRPMHEAADASQQSVEDLPVATPIFQLTTLPRFAHKVDPEYPAAMRALGREARVKLEVLIDAKGKVRKVTILESGGDAFDRAARSAVLASSFIPGNVEGKPVSVLMRIPISFRLK